jgi:hypothetical protein
MMIGVTVGRRSERHRKHARPLAVAFRACSGERGSLGQVGSHPVSNFLDDTVSTDSAAPWAPWSHSPGWLQNIDVVSFSCIALPLSYRSPIFTPVAAPAYNEGCQS